MHKGKLIQDLFDAVRKAENTAKSSWRRERHHAEDSPQSPGMKDQREREKENSEAK